jgi:asparagine synthase (glutamine-hydrolysing)
MTDVMIHRGPDDRGVFLRDRVALGHRRLSIVDVAGGHQPMLSDDGALCIVYNGEVYNHPVLRAELEARGHRYRTRCDTESVLRSYLAYGAEAPRHLRGMFAFAIWDQCQNELFLARDRFGVKPLYYVLTSDGSVFFASEIKALLAAGAVAPELNVGALPDYLANHATSGDETLFRGVRRLPPGSTLRWRDGDVEIARYWEPTHRAPSTTGRSHRALVTEFRERFTEAVRVRLMADVPLGVFLSGGIDSAAIAAEMSALVDEPIRTFSVAFAEREANELAYARLVAERFGTAHHEVVVSPGEFFAALPRLVWHEDEPIAHPSSVALHFVSRLAAQHVKVVLTGEGSDELLAGYGRYRSTMYNLALGRLYERLTPRAARTAMRALIDRLPRTGRLGRKLSRTALYLPADLTSLYFDNFAVFNRAQQQRLLRPSLRARVIGASPYEVHQELFAQARSTGLLSALLYVDSRTYLHELLMKQDQMSMAASIESRVPFLDHHLAEFVGSLPERLKLRGWTTKYILREAMRDTLPEEILSRRKMGFPVPVGRWLRGPFRWVLDEFVLGPRARQRGLFDDTEVRALVARHGRGEDHAERLWALVNLEVWQRQFLDGEAVDDIVMSPARAAGREPAAAAQPTGFSFGRA